MGYSWDIHDISLGNLRHLMENNPFKCDDSPVDSTMMNFHNLHKISRWVKVKDHHHTLLQATTRWC